MKDTYAAYGAVEELLKLAHEATEQLSDMSHDGMKGTFQEIEEKAQKALDNMVDPALVVHDRARLPKLHKPTGRMLRIQTPDEYSKVEVCGVDYGSPKQHMVGRNHEIVVIKGGNPSRFRIWRVDVDHGLMLDCTPLGEFAANKPYDR